MVDWNIIRKEFPLTKKLLYFHSAAVSPIPNVVLNAIFDSYRKLNEEGEINWEQDIESYQRVLSKFARYINTDKNNLCFMWNTSTAMSVIALSFLRKHKANFNIVSMEDEFPSSTVPFEYQNIKVKYVKSQNGRYSLESIMQQIDSETIAVVTSYVQYCTGFKQDLQKLGAELQQRKILFIVNATQAFPFYPIDVSKMNIDVMTASIHKWGFTGHVGSICYLSTEFRRRYETPFCGWLSLEAKDGIHTGKNVPLTLKTSADVYTVGTINLQAINALNITCDFLESVGFENIRNRIFELTDLLILGLIKRNVKIVSPVSNCAERSAIVVFNVPEKSSEELVAFFKAKNIYVGLRNDNIRIALNIFNNENDIEYLLKVLSDFVDG
ncbi:MAG: aminotransferase class V-fold PLP-dependent enzyme [Oligoflexia bacterium]|nr:aminotransferase class V-fold PLP-dependent enzyme [Oligoflexia bacterium]